MKQPSSRTISALAILEGDHHFQSVVEWLKEARAEQDETNRKIIDDVLLRQGQGRSQVLDEIIKEIYAAKENIRRKVNR